MELHANFTAAWRTFGWLPEVFGIDLSKVCVCVCVCACVCVGRRAIAPASCGVHRCIVDLCSPAIRRFPLPPPQMPCLPPPLPLPPPLLPPPPAGRQVHPEDPGYNLRPEHIESTYLLHCLTQVGRGGPRAGGGEGQGWGVMWGPARRRSVCHGAHSARTAQSPRSSLCLPSPVGTPGNVAVATTPAATAP